MQIKAEKNMKGSRCIKLCAHICVKVTLHLQFPALGFFFGYFNHSITSCYNHGTTYQKNCPTIGEHTVITIAYHSTCRENHQECNPPAAEGQSARRR